MRDEIDPDSFTGEATLHRPLEVVNILESAQAVTANYQNRVSFDINDHCARFSVMERPYPWHAHSSDEFFLVLEGVLTIELEGGTRLKLRPGDSTCVPAGTVHRTWPQGRTLNVCFEKRQAITRFGRADDA